MNNVNSRVLLTRIANFLRPKPRMVPLTAEQVLAASEGRSVVERFSDLYYTGGAARSLNWRGSEILKNPCDLWMMVELIQRLKPRVLIETGTHFGGSALFFADMARTLGVDCKVVTIDFNPKWSVDPAAHGIESLAGYTNDKKIVAKVRQIVEEKGEGHVLATLDASHTAAGCLEELEIYSPFVTRGSYVVAEDSNINGHPSFASHGPGPWEAVQQFLQTHTEFRTDLDCQRFLLTFNPNGWLKRVG